jgi:hypothetical protein
MTVSLFIICACLWETDAVSAYRTLPCTKLVNSQVIKLLIPNTVGRKHRALMIITNIMDIFEQPK